MQTVLLFRELFLFCLSRYAEQLRRLVEAGDILRLLPSVDIRRYIDDKDIVMLRKQAIFLGDKIGADKPVLRIIVVPEPVDHIAYADSCLKRQIIFFAAVAV